MCKNPKMLRGKNKFEKLFFLIFQGSKMEPSILPEETAEELAEVISPEQKPKTLEFKLGATTNVIQSVNSSEVVEVTTSTSAGVPIGKEHALEK